MLILRGILCTLLSLFTPKFGVRKKSLPPLPPSPFLVVFHSTTFLLYVTFVVKKCSLSNVEINVFMRTFLLLEDGLPDPSVPSLPAAAAAVRQLGGGGGGRGSSLLQVGKPCTNNNTNFLFVFYYSAHI
jgi:hypothetical protein